MKVKEFFKWLEPRLEDIFEDKDIQQNLGSKLREFHPNIRWEIGPGCSGGGFLAFSPNLDKGALNVTRMLANSAPNLKEWEFYPAKPRKNWKKRVMKISMEGKVKEFNFDDWNYCLTKFDDGEFFDVNLIPFDSEFIDISDLEYAGDLLVESELGELIYMELIDRVNIILPSKIECENNAIQYLYDQLLDEAKGVDKLK